MKKFDFHCLLRAVFNILICSYHEFDVKAAIFLSPDQDSYQRETVLNSNIKFPILLFYQEKTLSNWIANMNFFWIYSLWNYTPVHLIESVENCGWCLACSSYTNAMHCALATMRALPYDTRPSIKLYTIASYCLFHYHAQVVTFTDSTTWTLVNHICFKLVHSNIKNAKSSVG